MGNHDPINTTTERQVGKAVANYRALLEKHAGEFPAEAVQSVLGSTEFAKDQFALFRKRVEVMSKVITRTAPVNRSRGNKEAMLATGRTPYLNDHVLATIPKGESDTVTMMFYRPGRVIASNKLEEELAKDGFELVCDPIGQAAVNEADPEFADNQPNGTQWKDRDGNVCYALFYRWSDERRVDVDRGGNDWDGVWWFSVRRK